MTTTATFTTNSSLSQTNITSCSHINGLNFPTGYGRIPLFNNNLAIQYYVNAARNAELLMAARLNSASLNYTSQNVVSSAGYLNNPYSVASHSMNNSSSTDIDLLSRSSNSTPVVTASMSPPTSSENPQGFWDLNRPANDPSDEMTSSNPKMGETPNTESESTEENVREIMIVNTVLSFLKSESFRKDHSVIASVVKFFSLEEIMDCREELYRKTGCKRYQYRPPADPASTNEKSTHCVSSIISRCVELEKNPLI